MVSLIGVDSIVCFKCLRTQFHLGSRDHLGILRSQVLRPQCERICEDLSLSSLDDWTKALCWVLFDQAPFKCCVWYGTVLSCHVYLFSVGFMLSCTVSGSNGPARPSKCNASSD